MSIADTMTVADVRRAIAGLLDDLPVCGSGWYGEMLSISSATIGEVTEWNDRYRKHPALIFDCEDKGEIPD